MLVTDAGSVVSSVDTDSTMPASSPPPSYERVLEETKIAKMKEEDEEAIEESSTDDDGTVKPQQQQQQQQSTKTTGSKSRSSGNKNAPEIMSYKSSKEFYKAMAKQWGITCKMSDTCRCLDCQSRYFECSYEKYQDYDTYQEQSDGGLSASTPMFVSEIMHGSTCMLL